MTNPVVEDIRTGERIDIEEIDEIPALMGYGVEGYDEENDELWEEHRIKGDELPMLRSGREYRVVEDGVEMASVDGVSAEDYEVSEDTPKGNHPDVDW